MPGGMMTSHSDIPDYGAAMMEQPPGPSVILTINGFSMPPSANSIWRVVGRGKVARSAQYRQWLDRNAWLIRSEAGQQRFLVPEGTPFEVAVVARMDRRRDLDNIFKALLDCFRHSGITPDDRYCDRIQAIRDHARAAENSLRVSILYQESSDGN